MKHPKLIHIRHIHIRKRYFRRCLLVIIMVLFSAHYVMPDYEHVLCLLTNLVFFYDPVVGDTDT